MAQAYLLKKTMLIWAVREMGRQHPVICDRAQYSDGAADVYILLAAICQSEYLQCFHTVCRGLDMALKQKFIACTDV